MRNFKWMVMFVYLIVNWQFAFSQFDNWLYKEAYVVKEHTGSTLFNYQVPFRINTFALISTGKMKNDGSDIRFSISCDTASDLSYWIETGINTDTTLIWLKITEIPGFDSVKVIMHYGNSAATAASSVTSTFVRVIDSLRASWNMDEKGGTQADDRSGSRLHGTLMGNVTYVAKSARGPASLLSPAGGATDRLHIGNFGDIKDLDQAGPYTYMAWVSIKNNTNGGCIIGFGDCCTPRNGYTMNVMGDGRVRFWGGSDVNNTNYNLYSIKTVDDGKWHHVVIRVNSMGPEILINGKFEASNTLPNFPTSTSVVFSGAHVPNPPQIGGDGVSTTNGQESSIDEVQVYNSWITDDEIKDLYTFHAYATPHFAFNTLIRKYASRQPSYYPGTITILDTPTITQTGDTLTSDSAHSYQWYLDTILISGAINQQITNLQNGDYTVKVESWDGCEATSAPFTVIISPGMAEIERFGLQVYPNPVHEKLIIELNKPLNEKISYTLSSVSGAVLSSGIIEESSSIQKTEINMQGYSKGAYFIHLKIGVEQITLKFVKN